jgi:hypothetical protein
MIGWLQGLIVCWLIVSCLRCVCLQVQVYKKTAKQPLPSLKLFNPPTAAGGSGKVQSGDLQADHAHLAQAGKQSGVCSAVYNLLAVMLAVPACLDCQLPTLYCNIFEMLITHNCKSHVLQVHLTYHNLYVVPVYNV